MRLGKYLSSLTKPELEELKELLNLTEEEELVFNYLAKGKSKVSIADGCLVSVGTVSNRISAIQSKVDRIKRM
jgi:DNA-binding NarL/FixJ family response regulator